MTEKDNKDRLISDANFSHTTSVFTRPSYLHVFPAIFLYFLVIFGIFPLTTQIHIDQVCDDLNEDDCDSSNVSAHASTINLLASLALSITSILTCGIYGSIADVYGRKYAIICPFVGLMIYAATYLYLDTYNPDSYVALIIAANCIMGLSGSYIVFIMGSLCYTSDATMQNPQARRDVYSLAEATIITPEVFGPVLTGIWASYYGFFVPLLLGVILSGLAICYVIILPESLPPDAHSRTLPLQLSPLQTFSNVTFLFTYKIKSTAEDGSEPSEGAVRADGGSQAGVQKTGTEVSPLPHIGFAFLLFFMAVMGQSAVRIVYVKHRFGWDSGLIGIYDGMEGFVTAASMVFAPVVIQRVLCQVKPLNLVTWMQIGLLFRLLHWCLFGLVQDTAGIFVLLPLLFFVGPLAPYTRTIMSNTVSHAEQAQIFSAFSALEGIASLLAPLYSAGYTLFVQAGAPWLIFEVMAVAAGLALAVVTYVRLTPSLAKHIPEDHHHQFHGEEEGEEQSGLLDTSPEAADSVSPLQPTVGDPQGGAATGASTAFAHHSRASSRRSRSASSTYSWKNAAVDDPTTLQFYHLARPSAEAGAEGTASTLTARLLAEPREDYT